ncbi:hypothetical protein WCLP8_1790002 [uncultured Gammaproteobacteria bacterium]
MEGSCLTVNHVVATSGQESARSWLGMLDIVEKDYLAIPGTWVFTWMARPLTMAGLHGADNGRLIASSLEGRPFFFAFHRLTEADWWVLVGQPIEDLERPLRTWAITFALFGVLAFCTSLAAAFWLSSFLAHSVKMLTAAAAAIDREQVPDLPLDALPKEIRYVGQSLISAAERSQQRNADLRIALNKAEVANRAKASFLAVMSHELRTPLNTIIGFSAMMRDEKRGPLSSAEFMEFAGDIHSSGVHLLDVINNILDMAKIEAGRMVLKLAAIDLITVVEQSLPVIEFEAKQAGVKLLKDIGPCSCAITADAYVIKQILFNLLSNAIKFTPRGGTVTVRTACANCAAEGKLDGARLEVSDTGVGIAEDQLGHILEPFVQLDSALNRACEGAGLGLTVVDRLVRLHGGTLNIASTVGQGTTVTITLPATITPPVPSGDSCVNA